MFEKNLTEGLKLARFGGGGEVTRLICGYLVCEPRLSQIFLAGLPKILKVRITNEPADRWLENSIRFSVGEETSLEAGSSIVRAKLSEVLFVETLRRYINALPSEQTGWLAGARDPAIGQALALLHTEPAHPWTVANLSRRVGLSRTRLAERFRHFLEQSPMAYLTKWRLKLEPKIWCQPKTASRILRRQSDMAPPQHLTARSVVSLTAHRHSFAGFIERRPLNPLPVCPSRSSLLPTSCLRHPRMTAQNDKCQDRCMKSQIEQRSHGRLMFPGRKTHRVRF